MANIVLSSSSSSFSSNYNINNNKKNIEIEYLKNPILEWTTSLCNGKIYGCGLNTGNGIVSSIDNRFLYVTTDDGTLSIIKSKNGKVIKKYIPESKSDDDNDDDSYYTICQSSVSIFHKRKESVDNNDNWNDDDNNNWEIEYLVYSVTDISTKDDNFDDESRIITLDSKGNRIWSNTIKGISIGTPMIGTNGKYIYINHNTHNETFGQLSVLDAMDNGRIVYTSSSSNSLPFGPLSIQYNKDNNNNDILYWGESIGKGYSNKKYEISKVRKMIVNHNNNVNGRRPTFNIKIIHNLPSWSTNSEISISNNGNKLWMVGTESRVYSMYYNETEIEYKKNWRRHLDLSLRNSSAPIYNKVTTSTNEKYLYTSSSSTSFYCMDSDTGDIIWKNPKKSNNKSIYLTESKLSNDNKKLYSILHNDGTIIQQNAYNGNIDWKYNCVSLTGNPICSDSVKGDFTLDTLYSTTLYYGDIFGKIVALQIGISDDIINIDNTIAPTTTLTLEPTSSEPTITFFPTTVPSKIPTINPTNFPSNIPSYNPSISPTSNPSLSPSVFPSLHPSTSPTTLPSTIPSTMPTLLPSAVPSLSPTGAPTLVPSNAPSNLPSNAPSEYPSEIPSQSPSIEILPISPFLSFMNTASSKDKFIFSALCIIIALCFTMCCLLLPLLCHRRKRSRRENKWMDDIDNENHENVVNRTA